MKRYRYLDEWKGLGILLIMMQHAFQYYGDLGAVTSYVEGFHVTVFFLASGALAWLQHERKISFGETVQKKAKSLLIPFLVFSILNSALKLGVMGIQGQITHEVLMDEAIQFFLTGNGTVWFLSILFLIEMLFEIIRRLSGEKRQGLWLAFTALTGLIVAFAMNKWIGGPVGIVLKRVLVGYGFFVIGYFFHKNIMHKIQHKTTIAIAMITAGFLIWYCFGNGIDYFEGDFTALIPSVFLGTLSAVGYMLLFYQMEYTQKCRKFQAFLQYYGVHSLVVMVIHPILLMIIMYPFGSKIAALTGMCKDLTAILLFLFLVIGEIPFIRIIEQDLPFLIGRKGKKENG